jgi:hypothetical protein
MNKNHCVVIDNEYCIILACEVAVEKDYDLYSCIFTWFNSMRTFYSRNDI